MPFTLAHPAVAVPLARPLGRYGVLSALIIGSMTPDLWYLVPSLITRNQSHQFPGLLWFCLPAGCAIYWLYHRLMKVPLVFLLPVWISSRLAFFLAGRPVMPRVPWSAVATSVFVGAATHVLIDPFSHPTGRLSGALPELGFPLFALGHSQITVATLVQYAMSLAGIALLAWWSWRWLKSAPASETADPMPTGGRILVVLILAGLTVTAAAASVSPPQTALDYSVMRSYVRPALAAGLQTLACALLGYCALWHLIAPRWRRAH